MTRVWTVTAVGVVVLAASGCSGSSAPAPPQPQPRAGSGVTATVDSGRAQVAPTVPVTPDVPSEQGTFSGGVRRFDLTASAFRQKIASFPVKTATVWGYNGSTPGPTLIAYEGEQVQVVLHNKLPEATTVHLHGLHEPNAADGVAGISQPDPVAPGATFTYPAFTPRHTGTFAYHSHTDGAVQELRGLDGFVLILPKREPTAEHVDVDVAMVLQQFAPPKEGALVDPFPTGTGDFPFSTINGRTGEAASGPITIKQGDKVRIRLYNASNLSHSMHLHGHDEVLMSKNGHPVPKVTETTQNVAPGDFYEIEFTADNPGNWIFHCHVPHHTANKMMGGYHGAPVGMTRVFHYEGFAPVPPQYYAYSG